MIGRVTFERNDRKQLAELSDELVWTCPTNDVVERWLNTAYGPSHYGSPSDGRPGVRALSEAADWLGGKVQLGPAPSPPEDRHVAY